MRRIGAGVVLVAAVCVATSMDRERATAQSPTAFALVGGALVDGTGAGPVRDSVVLVRGDRIERVGTTATLPVPPFVDRMSVDERHALVDEAHARGKRIAAHGQTDEEVRLGLAIGVDDFQHVGIDSPEYPSDVMASLRARVKSGPPVYWTPTVGANGLLNAAYTASKPELFDDPEAYLGLPPAFVDEVREGWAKYQPRQPRADAEAIVKRKIAQLREAGVHLVFGSDEGSAGELARHATWMDADLWVRVLGMNPMDVIRSMTSDAAAVIGADRDSGSIAAGKYADIIAVGGDPLRHIDVLRDPKLVIKRGRRYK